MKTIIIILLVCLLFNLSGQTTIEKGTIIIELSNIRNQNGLIKVALFDDKDAYPTKPENAILRKHYEINSKQLLVHIDNINYGTYAISILHDENRNGKMDSNWLGIPKEGTGASNNAKGFFGPPKFKDASFELKEKETKLKIEMRY
jgi:uncharacterized protein (DUF2141 family)